MGVAAQTWTTKPKGVVYWLVRVVIIAVTAVWAVSLVLEGFMLIMGRLLWTIGGAEPGLPLDRLPVFLQAGLRPGTSGTMQDADLVLRLLNAVPLFVEALTVLIAAWLLLRVLRRVAEREAFTPTAISRWRALSVTLIAGGVLTGLLNTVASGYINWHLGLWPNRDGAGRDAVEELLGGDYSAIGTAIPDWPVAIIVAGLVALALTTAFRVGAQLERDVDGLA